MKNSVIAIESFVITTIAYVLLIPIFFEMDNAYGNGENFVEKNNDKTTMYSQQLLETECKSPCSSTAEMCIEICA